MSLARLLMLFFLSGSVAAAAGAEELSNSDPWEPLNRSIFAFNESLDNYILRPVAKGYHAITPDPIERGVGNFLSNMGELNNIVNSVLQGRLDNAAHNSGRFLVNSTLGVVGLLDIATDIGVEPRPADFGQTLAVWGVGQGPYLMLPLVGPSTLRSGTGWIFDGYASVPYATDDTVFMYSVLTADAIDTRARLLDAEQLISGDRYIFTRNAYLQRRAYFLSGGVVQDSFSEYEDEEGDEDYEDF